jgi:peptidoglycan/LPS O-acetylase OafA/YrhL
LELQISYSVYLMHMPALYWSEAYLFPHGWLTQQVLADFTRGYLILVALLVGTGTVVGVLHHTAHVVIEARLRRLLPRVGGNPKSVCVFTA